MKNTVKSEFSASGVAWPSSVSTAFQNLPSTKTNVPTTDPQRSVGEQDKGLRKVGARPILFYCFLSMVAHKFVR